MLLENKQTNMRLIRFEFDILQSLLPSNSYGGTHKQFCSTSLPVRIGRVVRAACQSIGKPSLIVDHNLCVFFVIYIPNEFIGFLAKGTVADNQSGNLRWYLPLGVRPPPLMAQISRHFLPHFFSSAIDSYIYETDFTLKKYHF